MLVEAERHLDLGPIDATKEAVDEYLRSVGDDLTIYQETGIAPPLFSAASALGALLKELALPPGAIHSLQEVETVAPVPIGSQVKVKALVEKPRRRGGLEFMTANCTVELAGAEAIKSKSTVLVPGEISRETPPKEAKIGDSQRAQSGLPVISRSIKKERLQDYAKISGDANPLHLDSDFASATQFGGIIAHGMLTLAFVSEMMTAAHGRYWLQTGSLRVRFRGAAYLGDQLETWGDLAKEQNSSLTYAVGVRKSNTGQELISGAAGLTIIQE